jgi:hypothetical protein
VTVGLRPPEPEPDPSRVGAVVVVVLVLAGEEPWGLLLLELLLDEEDAALDWFSSSSTSLA